MATNHRRMTCKEALKARYNITGRKENGVSEYALQLSFDSAQRYWNSLVSRDFDVVRVVAYLDNHVFYTE